MLSGKHGESGMQTVRRDPKPDYQKAIEDAYREWENGQPSPLVIPVSKVALRDLSGRIMRKVRDAGIVIGIDDGTDYAHRT